MENSRWSDTGDLGRAVPHTQNPFTQPTPSPLGRAVPHTQNAFTQSTPSPPAGSGDFLNTPEGLKFSFHRSTRVPDHETSRRQTVNIPVHSTDACELVRWNAKEENKSGKKTGSEYLLVLEGAL